MGYTQEDRTKHLEFIQNLITRMAGNSFVLKGWSITVFSGIVGFSLQSLNIQLLYFSLLPTLIFWSLDAYYLNQERLFRHLYDYVRQQKIDEIPPFTLDVKTTKKKNR